jgi:hypothetical protein
MRSHSITTLAALLVLVPPSACLEAPRPFGAVDTSDADSDISEENGVVVDDSTQGQLIVSSQGLRVRFDESRGWTPGALDWSQRIGSEPAWLPLLFTDEIVGDFEHGLGVVRYRDMSPSVATNDGANRHGDPANAPVRGPAVFQFIRTWTTRETDLTGTTTYTLHPDGRFHLHFRVQSGTSLPTGTYQAAYLALRAPIFKTLKVDLGPDTIPLSDAVGQRIPEQGERDYIPRFSDDASSESVPSFCVSSDGVDTAPLALAFAPIPTSGAVGLRVTEGWYGDSPESLRLQADWARPGLDAGRLTSPSELALLIYAQARSQCDGPLASVVADFEVPPAMTITTGESVQRDPFDQRGVDSQAPPDGYQEGTGMYALNAEQGARTVSFRFAGPVNRPTVRIGQVVGLNPRPSVNVTYGDDPENQLGVLSQYDSSNQHLYLAFTSTVRTSVAVTVSW